MKRKGLLRIFGLAAALGLVSLTASAAFPAVEPCNYYCDGGGAYQTWATRADCCSSNPKVLWCPPGEAPYGYTWGGYDYYEQLCQL